MYVLNQARTVYNIYKLYPSSYSDTGIYTVNIIITYRESIQHTVWYILLYLIYCIVMSVSDPY